MPLAARMRRLSPSHLALYALAGALTATVWAAAGEPWAAPADGAHYLRLARGLAAEAPFAFRPLAPALASALASWTGLSAEAGFFALSWGTLGLATAAFAALGHAHGSGRRGVLTAAFWALSFGIAYGATTGVRADPLLLLSVAGIVAVGRTSRPAWVLAAVAVGGVLAHEMAFFGLLALGVERASGAALFSRPEEARHGATWPQLLGAGLAAVAALALVRATTEALPATLLNWSDTSPVALAAQAVDYARGGVRYSLRVYAAFGPAAFFALAALAGRPPRDRVAAVGLVGVAVALTFLATDTLRVMALAGVVVLPLAAAFVDGLLARRQTGLATTALAVQGVFSAVVYGHLVTFEASPNLQVLAVALSIAGLGIAIRGARSPRWNAAPTPGAAPGAEPRRAERTGVRPSFPPALQRPAASARAVSS